MINLCLAGATGRMGRLAVELISSDKRFQLTECCVSNSSSALGQKVVSQFPKADPNLEFIGIDAYLLDFQRLSLTRAILDVSQPAGLEHIIRVYEEHRNAELPALVSGTTGINESIKNRLQKLGETHRILWTANFSLGIQTMLYLSKVAAKIFTPENGFDIELVETHHRNKKDAPSGTALQIIEGIKSGRSHQDFAMISDRSTRHEVRPQGEIGIHAVRGGDIIGEHDLQFLGDGEVFRLYHRATTRATFIHGALKAVEFLVNRSPGFYTMGDVFAAQLELAGSNHENIHIV